MIVTFRKKKILVRSYIYAIDLHSDYIVFLYVEDDEVYYRQLNHSLMRTLEKRNTYYREHFNVLFKHIGNSGKEDAKSLFNQLCNLYKAHLKRNKRINWQMTKKLIMARYKLA